MASGLNVDPEKTADAAGALHGAGKVRAPNVGADQFTSLGVHLGNRVPSVVEEGKVNEKAKLTKTALAS